MGGGTSRCWVKAAQRCRFPRSGAGPAELPSPHPCTLAARGTLVCVTSVGQSSACQHGPTGREAAEGMSVHPGRFGGVPHPWDSERGAV